MEKVDLLPKKHVMVKWLIGKQRVRCTGANIPEVPAGEICLFG